MYFLLFFIIIILIRVIYPIKDPFGKNSFNLNKKTNNDISINYCYLSPDKTNIKILHLIITRFMIDWVDQFGNKKIYKNDYILNGIRVMKKYLIPSLINQRCKKFVWILIVGNQTNITYIKSFLNYDNIIDIKVLYNIELKDFVRNITSSFEVLITTRIDYDDMIYYDAINDVRKAINLNKPILLYGYNSGLLYYEFNSKYYLFYHPKNEDGVMSVFISLIIILKQVNDVYTIYDIGDHRYVRKKLLINYRSYGIKELKYEPAIFDSGSEKFIFVRQKYSGTYNQSINMLKRLKEIKFSLNKFYGK